MVDGIRNGFGALGRRGRPRSWVYTAGTVARIDLRLPHHPRLGSPLLRCARYNRSQARAHPASAAARQGNLRFGTAGPKLWDRRSHALQCTTLHWAIKQ